MAKNLPRELDELCLDVGKFIEYWGFKEIEGRIWCHILLSRDPLCASDLMERAGVSKGLISISVSRLLEYNVIRVEYTKGKRTQYYQVNENVTDIIKAVLRSREKNMLAGIERSVRLLKDLPASELEYLSSRRIGFLLNLIKTASGYLKFILFGSEKISGLIFDKVPKVESKTINRNNAST